MSPTVLPATSLAVVLPPSLAWRAEFETQDPKPQAPSTGGYAPRQDQGQGPGTAGTGQPGDPRQQAPGPQTQDCYSSLWMFLPMIALFYFLLIRPQQKQEKVRREMLGKLEKGDKVVTSGGIHGSIASITNDIVVLKIDPKGEVRLTMDRSAIARVVRDEEKKTA